MLGDKPFNDIIKKTKGIIKKTFSIKYIGVIGNKATFINS